MSWFTKQSNLGDVHVCLCVTTGAVCYAGYVFVVVVG